MKKTITTLLLLISSCYLQSADNFSQISPYGKLSAQTSRTPAKQHKKVAFSKTTDRNDPIWTPIGQEGASLGEIHVSPLNSQLLFALGDRDTYYSFKSTDGGETWQEWTSVMDLGYENAESMDIAADGTIYLSYWGGGLYRSTDNGVTFTELNMPDPGKHVRAVTVSPTDPNQIFVGLGAYNDDHFMYQVIYNPSNSSATWSELPVNAASGMEIHDICIDPANTQNIYAALAGSGGRQGAIYKSANGGTSWQNITGSLPSNYGYWDVAISGSTICVAGGESFYMVPVGIFKSVNGGSSWQDISTGFPTKICNSVHIDPINSNLIYAGTDGDGVYISQNGGNSWDYTIEGAEHLHINHITADPQNSHKVLLSTIMMGTIVSNNDGATWAKRASGMRYLSFTDAAVDPSNPQKMLITVKEENKGTMFYSDNGGTNWTSPAVPPVTFTSAGYDKTGNMYAWSQGPGWTADDGLYQSKNFGITWNNLGPNQTSPALDDQIYDIAFSKNNPNLIFLAGCDWYPDKVAQIHRSTDGGLTWTEVFTTTEDMIVTNIAIFNDGTDQTIYASCVGYDADYNPTKGFIKSSDGGLNWVEINNGIAANAGGGSCLALSPNKNLVYGVLTNTDNNHSELYKTVDGGANWEFVYQFASGYSISDLLVNPTNEKTLYALNCDNENNVLMSADGGISWITVNNGIVGYPSRFSNIFVEDGKNKVLISGYPNIWKGSLGDAVSISEEENKLSLLISNYPNPFNPSTTINYTLSQSAIVQLKVYDIAGQEVASLVNGLENQGVHQINFNASRLSSGIYYYTLIAGEQKVTNRMLLVK